MTRLINLYRDAYTGLSRDSWMLAFVMFINRCGSMVIPFMSVYLTRSLHFSLKETGVILAIFGVGSMTGSLLGGWLADKIGHFRVQFLSLVLGGVCFLSLTQIQRFVPLAWAIFVTSVIYECLRPANATSVTYYSKPDQITRAFSLNRMAVNLGFSIGPVLAGKLAGISYFWLFIADGSTCILSGMLFYLFFRDRRKGTAAMEKPAGKKERKDRPQYDFPFLLFVVLVALFAIVFFQFFSSIPLYYKDIYHLDDDTIGLLLGFNGLIVFLFEMLIVHYAADRIALWRLIVSGTLLCGLSFVILNLFSGFYILVVAMFLLSVSEILAMPFMSTYTTLRSGAHNRGSYMGMYTLAYSAAFVLAPYLGTFMIAEYNYPILWWATGTVALLAAAAFYFVLRHPARSSAGQ